MLEGNQSEWLLRGEIAFSDSSDIEDLQLEFLIVGVLDLRLVLLLCTIVFICRLRHAYNKRNSQQCGSDKPCLTSLLTLTEGCVECLPDRWVPRALIELDTNWCGTDTRGDGLVKRGKVEISTGQSAMVYCLKNSSQYYTAVVELHDCIHTARSSHWLSHWERL